MTEAEGSATGLLAPIDPSHRIEALDMVRGFALFGVLLVNMYNFGAFSPIWTDTADRAARGVMHFFFETKSWRLFSLLFGLGVSLQLLRAQSRGRRFAPAYLRRLVVLFLIGMAHALLFPGDVLMVYAELGLLLLLFRKVSPRLLLGAALAILALFPLGRAANAVVLGDATADARAVDVERARALNEELLRTHPHAVGSLAEVVEANAAVIPPNPFGDPLGLESGLGFLAMFLLGLYAGKQEIFSNVGAHVRLFRRGAILGLSLGVLGMILERLVSAGLGSASVGGPWAVAGLALLGDLAFTYGSTALSIGYAAVIVLLAVDPRRRRLVAPLGPVGRLALSVYLTQTLAFTTLFYGYGFGRAFRIGPMAVTVWAIVIFAAQVLGCAWWVRRFRYGPAEWLWRALTYLTTPPMRAARERA